MTVPADDLAFVTIVLKGTSKNLEYYMTTAERDRMIDEFTGRATGRPAVFGSYIAFDTANREPQRRIALRFEDVWFIR